MENFDTFAADYKSVLDQSLKLGGEKGDYFCQYKARYIEKAIGKDFKGRILDYGCGVGLLSEALTKRFPNVQIDGFDVSSVSLQQVPATLNNQGIFTSDIKCLHHAYDLIVIANVLHHVECLQRHNVLKTLSSILSPKGKIIVFEHNPFNPLTQKIVKDSPLDKGVTLLPSSETVSYFKSLSFERRLEYIVFFPKGLSLMRWLEPYLGWCPLGAQYVITATRSQLCAR